MSVIVELDGDIASGRRLWLGVEGVFRDNREAKRSGCPKKFCVRISWEYSTGAEDENKALVHSPTRHRLTQ